MNVNNLLLSFLKQLSTCTTAELWSVAQEAKAAQNHPEVDQRITLRLSRSLRHSANVFDAEASSSLDSDSVNL